LDTETVGALREHRRRCEARAASLGIQLRSDGFVFSDSPDSSTFKTPSAVTHRYERLADRLGIDTTLHKLRHYSATELILAGVDIRTVAGRLGHAGGGTTTLRTYTAWVSEADQRAAAGWATRTPVKPEELASTQRARTDPRHPYEAVAADIARRVERGELRGGELAPTADELAAEHDVSVSTARRAVALARDWGVVVHDGVGRPRVGILTPPPLPPGVDPAAQAASHMPDGPAVYWSVTVVRPGGGKFAPRTVRGEVSEPDSFRRHLVGIVKSEAPLGTAGSEEGWIGDYELQVSAVGSEVVTAIFRWT
jgi:integrase